MTISVEAVIVAAEAPARLAVTSLMMAQARTEPFDVEDLKLAEAELIEALVSCRIARRGLEQRQLRFSSLDLFGIREKEVQTLKETTTIPTSESKQAVRGRGQQP